MRSALACQQQSTSSQRRSEEKYEILIVNYLALESRLLQIAADNTVRNILNYQDVFETRSALNTQLVNVLTAARLYLDQLPQDVAECLSETPDAGAIVKAQCSKEYDEHFEYRFMEALRNHAQHRGTPIHSVTQGSQWTSHGADARMEVTVDIKAQRQRLEEDPKFKRTVLNEMKGDVDLKAACRRYVESLSGIHEFARGLVAVAVASARATIESAHSRYAEIYSESRIGLTASAMEDHHEISSVSLHLDWDDVRLELQERNSRLINLCKRYVTGRALNDRK